MRWYVMWSQLSQCSQLLQSTTIVATPITIVAKNHNCRNCNHNCCHLINHKWRNCNHTCRIFFQKKIDPVNNDMWKKDDVLLILQDLSAIFLNKLSLFCPAKYSHHIFVANNLSAETKSGHIFCARPIASLQFCYFCGEEKHFKNEVCL